jgi:hypothetical protein
MTEAERNLDKIIKDGQSGKYKSFVRHYAGRVRRVIEMKNPLDGSILVDDIVRVIEIFNPDLGPEVDWLKGLQMALKLWVNEKVIANRLLGLKNDNEYDMRVFEKVVRERFLLSENPKPGIIETNFQTLVEMVEMGARRFGH